MNTSRTFAPKPKIVSNTSMPISNGSNRRCHAAMLSPSSGSLEDSASRAGEGDPVAIVEASYTGLWRLRIEKSIPDEKDRFLFPCLPRGEQVLRAYWKWRKRCNCSAMGLDNNGIRSYRVLKPLFSL